jgi:hypothetical protein
MESYNKKEWHIVKFKDSYAIRRIGSFGVARYLSNCTDSEWASLQKVKQYCLFSSLNDARQKLNLMRSSQEERKVYENPTFIEQ